MSVQAGTHLDSRYQLTERIAVGGMGEVWRASDTVLDRDVAVKVLRSDLEQDDAFRRRFKAEARTAGGLPHNGIAAVFDYSETTVAHDGTSPAPDPQHAESIAYLVMELVPGESLSSILLREKCLSPRDTLNIVAQAGRALHAAHLRGVIHRDVKPANLMVTPEGRVKVTDFGIARPVDHEPLTMTGQVMGTAHYLAPELAKGLPASALSDVYALGVVTYECLAGYRPFDGDNQVLVATAHLSQEPPPLPSTLPPDVVHLVQAAMAKEPSQRIATAQDFAEAAEQILAGQAWSAPTPTTAAVAAPAAATTTLLNPQPGIPPTLGAGQRTEAIATTGAYPYYQQEQRHASKWPLVIFLIVLALLTAWLIFFALNRGQMEPGETPSSTKPTTKTTKSASKTTRNTPVVPQPTRDKTSTTQRTTSTTPRQTSSSVTPPTSTTVTTTQSSSTTAPTLPTSGSTLPSSSTVVVPLGQVGQAAATIAGDAAAAAKCHPHSAVRC